jgi:molybdate transport system ATP-binding protein
MLVVEVEKRLGEFAVRAAFEAPDGVTALFGPSGAGKTSIVNMVAGLVTPDRGRIQCNGMLLFDSARGFSAPPHRRGIGYVFQDGRLFPHMTVAHNLDYGRRMYGLPRDADEQARVVGLLDIARLLDGRGSFQAASASASRSAARC